MNNTKISPSVLAAPLSRLSEYIDKLDENLVDYLHLDVMDGHFVPPITFGEATCADIGKNSNIDLDVHLMVNRPEVEVPKYFAMKPKIISFHYETTSFPLRIASEIRKQGIMSGISLNPITPIKNLEEIILGFDVVLLMTIEPGYYGQPFLANGFDRIKELDELRKCVKEKYDHTFMIEIDGGVTGDNFEEIVACGANILVSGSYVFKATDPNERIKTLKGM